MQFKCHHILGLYWASREEVGPVGSVPDIKRGGQYGAEAKSELAGMSCKCEISRGDLSVPVIEISGGEIPAAQ